MRVRNGMNTEHWGVVDQTEMLKKLGVLQLTKQNSARNVTIQAKKDLPLTR